MILGVGHLAMSVTDTVMAIKDFEAKGFSCVEVSESVANPPEKKTLLERFAPVHDMALLRPEGGGVTIEITNHGPELADAVGPYEYGRDHVGLRTPDLGREIAFWVGALRFKEGDGGALKLSSPIANLSLYLMLKEDANLKPCTLDARGYPCLALITNDIAREAAAAGHLGATDITPPFVLNFKDRVVDIIMFRTPGGAIVELIKIRRT